MRNFFAVCLIVLGSVLTVLGIYLIVSAVSSV